MSLKSHNGSRKFWGGKSPDLGSPTGSPMRTGSLGSILHSRSLPSIQVNTEQGLTERVLTAWKTQGDASTWINQSFNKMEGSLKGVRNDNGPPPEKPPPEPKSTPNAVSLIVWVLSATGLPAQRVTGRLRDPFLAVEMNCITQVTTIKKHTLDPVWKEIMVFLMDGPEATIRFDMRHKAVVDSDCIGQGQLTITADMMKRLVQDRLLAKVGLLHQGENAGTLRLEVAMGDARKCNILLNKDLRDISSPDTPPATHYLVPFMRKLCVRVVDAQTPSAACKQETADPFVVVKCGLFKAQTDTVFSTTSPVWDQAFYIAVPHRTVGCHSLPQELQFDGLELQLHNWDPSGGSEVSRIHVPFSEIDGVDGCLINPDTVPIRQYTLKLNRDEKLKRSVCDVAQRISNAISKSSPSHSECGDGGVIRAALYFDKSYDPPTQPIVITATLRLDELRVATKYNVVVVMKYERHWVTFPVNNTIDSSIKLNRVFQIVARDPRAQVTIAIVARLQLSSRVLGIVHIRVSSAKPFEWQQQSFPLLTRGSKWCHQHGFLTASILVEAPSFLRLCREYLRPPLAPRYYNHPWTDEQLNAFKKYQKEAILVFLSKQEFPIDHNVASDMLAHEFVKFEFGLVKAHFRRCKAALLPLQCAWRTIHDVMHWKNPPVSFVANVLWVLAMYYPREIFTLFFLVVSVKAAIFFIGPHPLPLMDPSLSGGMNEDDEEEAKKAGIIVTLQRKIERFEHVATRVQAIMDKAASALEAFVSLFCFTDYTITAIIMMALTALCILIWLFPFNLLLAVLGLILLRHPSLRKPTPSPPLCLLSRLPNKADRVIYTKQ
eukprot:GGOE01005794.1.p1 GENE.GGOE01005794.1~~GGOE01005794.1.p1  ORF type:complete len:830 (-),score=178.65 GGOE01005794.1:273-2762(-)